MSKIASFCCFVLALVFFGGSAFIHSKLVDARRQLEEGRQRYAAGLQELEGGKKLLAKKRQELEEGIRRVEAGARRVNDGERRLGRGKKEYQERCRLVSILPACIEGKKRIEQGERALAAGRAELERGRDGIKEGRKRIADAEKRIAEGEQRLKQGEKQLSEGREKIRQAELVRAASAGLGVAALLGGVIFFRRGRRGSSNQSNV